MVSQAQGKQERGVGRKREVACYCSPKHMDFWLCTDACSSTQIWYEHNNRQFYQTSSLPSRVLTE